VNLKTNRVDEGTNWDAFQNNLKELFDEEWVAYNFKWRKPALERLEKQSKLCC
jgi:hypothetical protein